MGTLEVGGKGGVSEQLSGGHWGTPRRGTGVRTSLGEGWGVWGHSEGGWIWGGWGAPQGCSWAVQSNPRELREGTGRPQGYHPSMVAEAEGTPVPAQKPPRRAGLPPGVTLTQHHLLRGTTYPLVVCRFISIFN